MFKYLFACFLLLSNSLCGIDYPQISRYKLIEIKNNSVAADWVTSINEDGLAVGWLTFNRKNYHFRWDKNGDIVLLDERRSGFGPYINNKGDVSDIQIPDNGTRFTINGYVLCRDDIPVQTSLKWDNSYKIKINNSDQVLGMVKLENGHSSVVLYDSRDNSIQYITSPLKYKLYPEDINDLGWVVCSYHDGINFHGILWNPDIGAIIIENMKPSAINNKGVVIGSSIPNKPPIHQIPGLDKRAFLWYQGIKIDVSKELKIDRDFSNNMLWISELTDINDQGQIVGWGPNTSHSQQAVLIEWYFNQ